MTQETVKKSGTYTINSIRKPSAFGIDRNGQQTYVTINKNMRVIAVPDTESEQVKITNYYHIPHVNNAKEHGTPKLIENYNSQNAINNIKVKSFKTKTTAYLHKDTYKDLQVQTEPKAEVLQPGN